MENNLIPSDVNSFDNYDGLTNKSFENDINSFVEKYKSGNQGERKSQKSTINSTSEKRNETDKNEKKKNYYSIENYLIEGRLPIKEFKDSKNFIEKSKFPEKMKEIEEKNIIKNTPIPEKVSEKKSDFVPLSQNKPSKTPSILIMETIDDNKLYTVYQDLIKRDFSVISYNLKEVKNPSKANCLTIRNYPYLSNNYLTAKFNFYKYYFSAGGKKEIIFPPKD
jgi:hypothetical protein